MGVVEPQARHRLRGRARAEGGHAPVAQPGQVGEERGVDTVPGRRDNRREARAQRRLRHLQPQAALPLSDLRGGEPVLAKGDPMGSQRL